MAGNGKRDATCTFGLPIEVVEVGPPVGKVWVCAHGWCYSVQKRWWEAINVKVWTQSFNIRFSNVVEVWTLPNHMDKFAVLCNQTVW